MLQHFFQAGLETKDFDSSSSIKCADLDSSTELQCHDTRKTQVFHRQHSEDTPFVCNLCFE